MESEIELNLDIIFFNIFN